MFYLREGRSDGEPIEIDELLRGVAFGKIRPSDMITNSEDEWVAVKDSQFFGSATEGNIQLQAALQLLTYQEDKKRGQMALLVNMDYRLGRIWNVVGAIGFVLLLSLHCTTTGDGMVIQGL